MVWLRSYATATNVFSFLGGGSLRVLLKAGDYYLVENICPGKADCIWDIWSWEGWLIVKTQK